MKYGMIFKYFNIIPPISVMLAIAAYFSFLTKFIITHLKYTFSLSLFFPIFISLCFTYSVSIFAVCVFFSL